jgi:hypothetical protein
MVRTYQDMDELLAIVIKVEKVVGEIGETPYEPLQEKRRNCHLERPIMTNIFRH